MQKNSTVCKKDDKQKSRFSITSKGVGISSDISPSRKALTSSLHNIYLILDLLYHKCDPLIMTAVDGSIF